MRTSSFRRHLPIGLAFFALSIARVHAQTYTTIDFPGGFNTSAYSINDLGDVVGHYDDADGNTHGFLLHRGQYTTIDVPGAMLGMRV